MSNEYAIAKALTAGRASIPGSLRGSKGPLRRLLAALTSTPYPPASSPGGYPHRRTGRLTAGWRTDSDGDTIGAANEVHYWKFLEGGTRKMAPRPSLGPGMRHHGAPLVRRRLADDFVRAERGRR